MNSIPSPESRFQIKTMESKLQGIKECASGSKSNFERLDLNTEVELGNGKPFGRSSTFYEQIFNTSKDIFRAKDQHIHSSQVNDLCNKLSQKYHTEKSFMAGSSMYRIDPEFCINAGASSLLNLQIKDLERRTKSNRISATSHSIFSNLEFDGLNVKSNLSNKFSENDNKQGSYKIEFAPSDKEIGYNFNFTPGEFESDYNLYKNSIESKALINQSIDSLSHKNTFNHQSDKDYPKIINYNIVNYNPIITNNFNCNHSEPENLFNPDTILEKYYYHLRQLQHYYSMYLNNVSSRLAPEEICSNSISASLETKNPEALSKSIDINSHLQSDQSETPSLTPENQGWICQTCSNFYSESREDDLKGPLLNTTKCSRCLKIVKLNPIVDDPETTNYIDTEAVTGRYRDVLTDECISSKKSINYKSKQSNQAKHHHERAGDWLCSFCKNLNFSFRIKCNRCQAAKEEIFEKENETGQKCIFRQTNIRPINRAERAFFYKMPSTKNFNPTSSNRYPPLITQNYQSQYENSGYYYNK